MLDSNLYNRTAVLRDSLQAIKKDGFVLLEKAICVDRVESIRRAFAERISAPVAYGGFFGKGKNELNVTYADLPLTLHRDVVSYVLYDLFIKIVEGYLESSVCLSYVNAYRTHIITDEKTRNRLRHPGAFSGWHSDFNVNNPTRGYRCMVVMLYLTDVNAGAGGLQLIRGSHIWGGEKREWTNEEIGANKGEIVEVCGPAGTVVIFDMEIIHRAGVPTEIARDILRGMYVPKGGYVEPLLFVNDTLPANLTTKQLDILGFGRDNSIPMTLSEGVPLRRYSREWFIAGFAKKIPSLRSLLNPLNRQ